MPTLAINLATTFGQESWDLTLPDTVTPPQIIRKLQKDPQFKVQAAGEDGRAIDYQLLWREGARVLGSGETLASAQVQDSHHLVIQQEARAGSAANC